MSYKMKSVGCFPGQTAVTSVDPEDLKKLTYSTTSKSGTPWRSMAPEDKWENMSDVHAIGQKNTPYLKYQKSTAPLLDHSALCSRREFFARPLGDSIVNTALANSFKSGTFTSRKGLDVSAKQDSMYTAEFVEYDARRMAGARQKSFKPKPNRANRGTQLMETRSASQLTFQQPCAELAKAAEISLARPNLGLSGSWNGGPPKSSYGHEFNRPLARSQSAVQVSELGLPDPPVDLLPHSHPVFHVRRACHMSPGQ